jgi:hypothetical protein
MKKGLIDSRFLAGASLFGTVAAVAFDLIVIGLVL